MKIPFKSLPISGAWSTPINHRVNVVTTVFDVSDVRDHALETSWWNATVRWTYHSKAIGIWMLLCLGLTSASKGNPWFLIPGSILLLLACAWIANMFGREDALLELARRERGLPAGAKLKVVEAAEWPSFKKRLQW